MESMLSSCYGARVWLPPRPESGDSQSVLNLRNARKPDVAIVDSQVLGTNGAELASKIKRLAPVVGSSIFTNSPASIPNRLLIWGGFSLPWKMRVLPMLEYRSGFPYALRDVRQNYLGTPYSDHTRFPRFFSFDASLFKEVQITPKYTVQFAVRGLKPYEPVQSSRGPCQYGRPAAWHFIRKLQAAIPTGFRCSILGTAFLPPLLA